MANSIIKLEDYQLDEVLGGTTAKESAKKIKDYVVKGIMKVFGGAISCGSIPGYIGFKLLSIPELYPVMIVPIAIGIFTFFAVPTCAVAGAIGAVGAMIGDGVSEILCKKLNLED